MRGKNVINAGISDFESGLLRLCICINARCYCAFDFITEYHTAYVCFTPHEIISCAQHVEGKLQ